MPVPGVGVLKRVQEFVRHPGQDLWLWLWTPGDCLMEVPSINKAKSPNF